MSPLSLPLTLCRERLHISRVSALVRLLNGSIARTQGFFRIPYLFRDHRGPDPSRTSPCSGACTAGLGTQVPGVYPGPSLLPPAPPAASHVLEILLLGRPGSTSPTRLLTSWHLWPFAYEPDSLRHVQEARSIWYAVAAGCVPAQTLCLGSLAWRGAVLISISIIRAVQTLEFKYSKPNIKNTFVWTEFKPKTIIVVGFFFSAKRKH